ncbi:MAG: glycine betaine ABC transporter substrate-binding protein, partial [Pseudomonadota bacterium]
MKEPHKVLLRSLMVGVACATFSVPAFGATVIIGLPDWPSAQVTAHIIAEVIEEKLGEDARLMPVETTQIIGAIDRGEVDVHPEVWLPNSEA